MKILYVEDELSKNIPRITRLFSKYLRKQEVDHLEALEKDESGYGADPGEIKEIVEATHIVEIDYRFPEALRKIIHDPEKYSLFIIDRNLLIKGEEYAFEEVNEIDGNYSKAQYENFRNREGDYLLHKLVFSGVDVMTNFYFLTAYPAQDEIRGSNEIETLINFGKFKADNFIEKGNSRDFERLQQIINNIKILNVQSENIDYLNILRTYIDKETAESFVKILDEKDDTRGIKNAPNAIRKIYEKILWVSSKRIPGMKKHLDNYRSTLTSTQTINWLTDKKHIQFIHRPFFLSITTITNELSHSNYAKPTTDTINALVYMLKDIILWLERICRRHSKR